jgi:hypothetical protein
MAIIEKINNKPNIFINPILLYTKKERLSKDNLS